MSEFLKTVGVPLVQILSKSLNISLEKASKGVAKGIESCLKDIENIENIENVEKSESIDDIEDDKIETVKKTKTSRKKNIEDSKEKNEDKQDKQEKEEKKTKRKKNISNDCGKICEYIFQRSPKKGEKCGSKVDKNSEKFCSKHIKKENEKVKPVVEKKVKVVEKIKTQKRVKSQELSQKLSVFVENAVSHNRGSPFIKVERNKHGNYQCLDEKISKFVIDPQTLEMTGIQRDDGGVDELSKSDIDICKELGYNFKLPLSLSSATNQQNEEKMVEEDNDTDDNCESCYEESEIESDGDN